MADAAAVGRAAEGGKILAEVVHHVHDGLGEVHRAEDVAAEVEHQLFLRGLFRHVRQPGAVLGVAQ